MSQSDEPGRGLDAAAFASLLKRLGPDAEHAGAAYEALRRALVGFFTWRGAATPEECADETLDRLASRLKEGTPVDDVPRYTRGIARLVLLEQWRSPEARAVSAGEAALERLAAPEPLGTPEDEPRGACFEKCLSALPAEGRRLILGYYAAQGQAKIENRKRLADSLGLSDNALRSRAQRIRDRLERCVGRCLSLAEPDRHEAVTAITSR